MMCEQEMWVDIRTATREQMQSALCIHRDAIVEACRQLQRDVDSYNENTNKGEPLTVSFDFSGDAYTDATEFGFGEALRRLKAGKRLARRGWHYPEGFYRLDALGELGNAFRFFNRCYGPDGVWVSPDLTDILAEDWFECPEDTTP